MTDKTKKFSIGDTLKALKQAIHDGNITSQQANKFRRDVGISKSSFTSKKINLSKRKRINKLAKQARKITHESGHKGQKTSNGKH